MPILLAHRDKIETKCAPHRVWIISKRNVASYLKKKERKEKGENIRRRNTTSWRLHDYSDDQAIRDPFYGGLLLHWKEKHSIALIVAEAKVPEDYKSQGRERTK